MKIEAKYNHKVKQTTVKDFESPTALWVAASSWDKKTFPNCDLILVLKTARKNEIIVSLTTGFIFENTGNWKAIEADVKIVNN